MTQEDPKEARIKFKHFRLWLDDLKSIARGWYFYFSTCQAGPLEEEDPPYCLADFSTRIKWREGLNEINRNRIDNMKLSCGMVDGLVLEPGEIFSLRRLIGEPTVERGFKKGPMIMRESLGFTTGGGLCQVSTTLFNAALQANLAILEKFNHSIDIWGEERFIDLGRDAIYVYARKDLKFKNTHPNKVIIRIKVLEEEKILNCRILSTNPLPGYSVEIQSKIIRELLPKLKSNSLDINFKPIKGWIVVTTRFLKWENGRQQNTYQKREKYQPILKKLEV